MSVPEAVNKTESPSHNVVVPEIETVGKSLTVKCTESAASPQEFVAVTLTCASILGAKYSEFVGQSIETMSVPEAVSKTESPLHNVVVPEIETVGKALTVNCTESATLPHVFVAMTLTCASTVGAKYSELDGQLIETMSVPEAVNNTESPLHNVVVPAIETVGKALTVNCTESAASPQEFVAVTLTCASILGAKYSEFVGQSIETDVGTRSC